MFLWCWLIDCILILQVIRGSQTLQGGVAKLLVLISATSFLCGVWWVILTNPWLWGSQGWPLTTAYPNAKPAANAQLLYLQTLIHYLTAESEGHQSRGKQGTGVLRTSATFTALLLKGICKIKFEPCSNQHTTGSTSSLHEVKVSCQWDWSKQLQHEWRCI